MNCLNASSLPTVRLINVRVHAIRERDCIDQILGAIDVGRGGWVVTPNLEILRQAARDESARKLIEQADLVVPDGMPLVWASRLQGTPLPERVAGSTLILTLSEAAGKAGRSVYLLGGAPGAAERAANALELRYPGLMIAGTYCPPFGFERDPHECDRIRDALHQARPDIVFVALGFPKQERLIARLRQDIPGCWWIGVGISLSFLAGDVKRAPPWAQRLGLEWFHRLSQEPRRLSRRYLIDGPPFALRLLAQSAWRGLTQRAAAVRSSLSASRPPRR